MLFRRRLCYAIWCGLLALSAGAATAGGELRTIDTPYYTIHTDLDEAGAKEAALRLTRLFETYRQRTRDFREGANRADGIDQKLPFYLYREEADYITAGGRAGTAGVFVSDEGAGKLMALAGARTTLNTWHTVQHEGFHQFAHRVIRAPLPTWLNEGLAEYFGEGIFTGDGFLTGVVPRWRLQRLRQQINAGALKPVSEMMALSHEQWSSEMSLANYDQAWSMVHFLVHGDNEKYQPAFAACIREMSAGKTFEQAWLNNLGPADGFEARWKTYWLAQPAEGTADLYSQAIVSILTSFLARATAQGQTFDSFESFTSTASIGQLKIAEKDWLPASLLSDALESAKPLGRWSIVQNHSRHPALRLVNKTGTTFTGSFLLNAINVKIDRPSK